MNKSRHTPWLLLLIGGGFLALTAWSIYQARQGASNVTDRDYYSHGLRYNETLLEKRAAETLGWTTQISLQNGQLRVFLQDSEHHPVNHAHGALVLLNIDKYSAIEYPLQEGTAGRYSIQLPSELEGEFSADLTIERDGARLSKRILLNLN